MVPARPKNGLSCLSFPKVICFGYGKVENDPEDFCNFSSNDSGWDVQRGGERKGREEEDSKVNLGTDLNVNLCGLKTFPDKKLMRKNLFRRHKDCWGIPQAL